ncbi:hypothetical protein D3C80_1972170 [compost metagenome]
MCVGVLKKVRQMAHQSPVYKIMIDQTDDGNQRQIEHKKSGEGMPNLGDRPASDKILEIR